MLHVYKSEVRVAIFETQRSPKHSGFNPVIENHLIELFGPVFLKLGEVRWKEAFHTITDFTFLHVLSRNSK